MTIRAPFDGVLGARLVSPGDRVDPDTGLVSIDAITRLRLVFTLPEIAVPLARVGVPLELTVAARPGETFQGEVYFVAPSLDAANRRLLLKALVPNPEHKLRPGMFATIRVEVARHANALVVPEAAIAYDASGPYVWLLGDNQTASRAPVTIGLRNESQVEITKGLAAGNRIVSGGTHKVSAGAPLQAAAAPRTNP
jgi:membrane fusion protein (multidrug efflux system)